MKIATLVAATSAIRVTACASEPHPWKHPLSLEQASAIADSRVNLVETNDGIEKTWFAADNTSVGAHEGWIGPLVTATVDNMIKSGPSGEAQRVADEIATIGAVERINARFHDELKGAVASMTCKIRFSDGATSQPLLSARTPDDTVMMNTTYLLSDDATVLS